MKPTNRNITFSTIFCIVPLLCASSLAYAAVQCPTHLASCSSKDGLTISVMDCGATINDATDDTAAIQDAICTASANGGRIVRLPAGVFYVKQIEILSGTKLIGNGSSGSNNNIRVYTQFQAAPSNGGQQAMINIDASDLPIVDVAIENIQMSASANYAQDGLRLLANPSGATGGVWHSTFRNLSLLGFTNKSIRILSTDTNYNHPNQFLTFENVKAKRGSGLNSNSLYISGQVGQLRFIQSQFDGVSMNGDDNSNVVITTTISPTARNIHFDGCTFQNAKLAMRINPGADNVIIENGWFENLSFGLLLQDAQGIIVAKNHFANACTNSCIRMGGTIDAPSTFTFENNLISGALTNGLFAFPEYAKIYAPINYSGREVILGQ